jgi:hypothetical protein
VGKNEERSGRALIAMHRGIGSMEVTDEKNTIQATIQQNNCSERLYFSCRPARERWHEEGTELHLSAKKWIENLFQAFDRETIFIFVFRFRCFFLILRVDLTNLITFLQPS